MMREGQESCRGQEEGPWQEAGNRGLVPPRPPQGHRSCLLCKGQATVLLCLPAVLQGSMVLNSCPASSGLALCTAKPAMLLMLTSNLHSKVTTQEPGEWLCHLQRLWLRKQRALDMQDGEADCSSSSPETMQQGQRACTF